MVFSLVLVIWIPKAVMHHASQPILGNLPTHLWGNKSSGSSSLILIYLNCKVTDAINEWLGLGVADLDWRLFRVGKDFLLWLIIVSVDFWCNFFWVFKTAFSGSSLGPSLGPLFSCPSVTTKIQYLNEWRIKDNLNQIDKLGHIFYFFPHECRCMHYGTSSADNILE